MGWLGGFLRRSVLGVFWDSAGGGFCDSGRVFGYGKGGFLHQWWFSATVTGVYYIGAGPQRSVGWLGSFFATVGVGGSSSSTSGSGSGSGSRNGSGSSGSGSGSGSRSRSSSSSSSRRSRSSSSSSSSSTTRHQRHQQHQRHHQ